MAYPGSEGSSPELASRRASDQRVEALVVVAREAARPDTSLDDPLMIRSDAPKLGRRHSASDGCDLHQTQFRSPSKRPKPLKVDTGLSNDVPLIDARPLANSPISPVPNGYRRETVGEGSIGPMTRRLGLAVLWFLATWTWTSIATFALGLTGAIVPVMACAAAVGTLVVATPRVSRPDARVRPSLDRSIPTN